MFRNVALAYLLGSGFTMLCMLASWLLTGNPLYGLVLAVPGSVFVAAVVDA